MEWFTLCHLFTLPIAVGIAGCPKAWVYLDAGDSRWNPPSDIVPLSAGWPDGSPRPCSQREQTTIRKARCAHSWRTSIGVSDEPYPFVYDVSRNGNGPDAQGNRCNPGGRNLGVVPSAGGSDGLDARLWVKHPGTSDGNCGAYPNVPSGQFDPRIAVGLINGT